MEIGHVFTGKGIVPRTQSNLTSWIKLSQLSDFWVLKKSCPLKSEFEMYFLKDPKVNEGMDVSNKGNECGHMVISSSSTATFSFLSRQACEFRP